MLRSWNSIITLSLCAIICASCGFLDLRPIEYSIEPDKPDSLLSDSHTPVILRFGTEMKQNDAEKILQVTSDTGVINGDFLWNGNDLYFTPVPEWTAGIKYTLSLLGIIRSVDGRELRVERFISFYAINKNEPPLLEWHNPSYGASIGTGDVVFEFHFSRPMDRLSVESALTIEGIGNKIFEWSDDDKKLRVTTDKAFTPWTSYRWNLRDSAKSADGVPLPKTYSGYFTTDEDQTLPRVVGVFPVLYSDGSWFPTGADIETRLEPGQGIAVEFNKPMGDNVLRSVRFEPSLTGRTELLSEKSIVYIFTKDPEPETTYTLIVSADTKDSEGLKTGIDYKINFKPDIPFLNVLSFFTDSEKEINDVSSNTVLPVNITQATGEFAFYIGFSLPFSMEEKQNTAMKITLAPFFPRTLASAALKYVGWHSSDDSLYMCWEGLEAGNGEIPHYYKLTIPGGKSGINNGSGMYMKEDVVIYLEAIDEKQIIH